MGDPGANENPTRRVGWGFVVLDRDSDAVAASAYGQCPWWITSVYGAELFALAQAAPVTAYLDEIFLEPTDRQLDAYYRVLLRGKV